VSARRWEDLAWAEAFGYGVEQTDRLEGWLCGYDLIVNTVPAPVLGRARLGELKEDCLVIDLASKPGGVDLQAAGELGVKVIWALSLPGKVAPVTAARAILRTVYNMISEWRI
jgi:dipicolinate synthase subunit A